MSDFLWEMSGLIGFLVGLVVLGVWLAAVVNAARTKSWGWFAVLVITLFLPVVILVLATIAYFPIAYKSPAKLHETERRRRKARERRIAVRDEQIEELRERVDELEGRAS
jgi:MFS family permease